MSQSAAVQPRHEFTRVRRETRRRILTVAQTSLLTPRMQRVVFTSPDLHDFASDAPDDHVKLFLPVEGGTPGTTVMRDYTPRAFDAGRGELTIDFALHEAGPATDWAVGARPGDRLEIGGPRGSLIVPDDFDWYLLIGDETALPAIGRRVEALRAGVPVTTIVLVDDPAEAQAVTTAANWSPVWLFRDGAHLDDATLLLDALPARLPAGDGFVWIAAEARAVRAVRQHVVDSLGHPKHRLKASGYWVRGEAGAHEKFGD